MLLLVLLGQYEVVAVVLMRLSCHLRRMVMVLGVLGLSAEVRRVNMILELKCLLPVVCLLVVVVVSGLSW